MVPHEERGRDSAPDIAGRAGDEDLHDWPPALRAPVAIALSVVSSRNFMRTSVLV
jgi:hypothetical protein